MLQNLRLKTGLLSGVKYLRVQVVPSGLKKTINGDFKRRVLFQEQAALKEKRFVTEKQVAWMIYEYFKVSDSDESVLDLNDIFF